MDNENIELNSSDFLRTPPSSQSDCSQTNNASYFDHDNYHPFELTPSDFQSSLSTLTDPSDCSWSNNRSNDREPETSFNRNDEYILREHYSWTTSTNSESNGNPFFPSYHLSTDTPFSTQNNSRLQNSLSSPSLYYTANTHFSSSEISSSSQLDQSRYPWEISFSDFPRDPISASTSYYNEQDLQDSQYKDNAQNGSFFDDKY
jgi:hypothetical protein